MKPFKALGVHTFAGGFVYGLRQGGVKLDHSLESSTFGVKTAQANNPGLDHTVGFENWKTVLREFIANTDPPDFVVGQPACSCWSPMGRSMSRGRNSWHTDPNLEGTVSHVAVGDILRPKIWVTESVPQFEMRGAAAGIGKFFLDRGYNVTLTRVDAKFFDVPQQRRRVFLVAHKLNIPWEFPPFRGFIPVGAALEGVPFYEEEAGKLYPELMPFIEKMPQGGGLREQMPEGWTGRKARIMDNRLRDYTVSGTISGMDCLFHPTEHRKLSWREAATLGGYPADWEMHDYKHSVDALGQLMKAVMPPMGKWLGEQFVAANALGSPTDHPTAEMITHWAKGTRITNFDLVDTRETWTSALDGDSGWVEDRVSEFRERIQL